MKAAQVSLRIAGYESPQITTGSDANWLACQVEIVIDAIGGFRAEMPITLLTAELERFRDELRALDRDLTGAATLVHLENEFGITIRLNSGKGTIAGFVRAPVTPELRFDDIATDQSLFRDALRQIEALVNRFPVRGHISA